MALEFRLKAILPLIGKISAEKQEIAGPHGKTLAPNTRFEYALYHSEENEKVPIDKLRDYLQRVGNLDINLKNLLNSCFILCSEGIKNYIDENEDVKTFDIESLSPEQAKKVGDIFLNIIFKIMSIHFEHVEMVDIDSSRPQMSKIVVMKMPSQSSIPEPTGVEDALKIVSSRRAKPLISKETSPEEKKELERNAGNMFDKKNEKALILDLINKLPASQSVYYDLQILKQMRVRPTLGEVPSEDAILDMAEAREFNNQVISAFWSQPKEVSKFIGNNIRNIPNAIKGLCGISKESYMNIVQIAKESKIGTPGVKRCLANLLGANLDHDYNNKPELGSRLSIISFLIGTDINNDEDMEIFKEVIPINLLKKISGSKTCSENARRGFSVILSKVGSEYDKNLRYSTGSSMEEYQFDITPTKLYEFYEASNYNKERIYFYSTAIAGGKHMIFLNRAKFEIIPEDGDLYNKVVKISEAYHQHESQTQSPASIQPQDPDSM